MKPYAVKYGLRERHPAWIYYVVSMSFLLAAVIMGFTAVFIPWAIVDVAVGARAIAHPFYTCIANTFSPVHEETCVDNDFIVGTGKGAAPLTQGDSTCEAFVLTVIGCVFSSVIGGIGVFVAMGFFIYQIWSKPLIFAIIIEVLLIILLWAFICAWVLWIFYAERECVPNSIFPIRAYSYGFVTYVFASFACLVAVVAAFLGFFKLKNYKPLTDEDIDNLYGGAPFYPEYPDYPLVVEPTPPTPFLAPNPAMPYY